MLFALLKLHEFLKSSKPITYSRPSKKRTL